MNTYYKSGYEIRRIGESIETNGPVRVLFQEWEWTDEGSHLSVSVRRELLHVTGEIRERKPSSSAFDEGKRGICGCGAEFIGPPNRRRCDGCKRRKG